ncbi:VOC family protein [Agrobacterium rhizogenes]|uniref:VOC family protein n=1 Tax=Rhizobium rhizogenes TaxID=359 RepID=UPI00157467F5|nr:VOC family protein [Rhizobium rhizogenes]NTF52876.1 VOC family protein [Rhizobium rhizogenes]NTF65878.1 VOC family protein [Rhizobium rhizogenes]NTG04795.1 VOC family protein [Rhizobium rhizogenes]NTG32125.1 VOC family protein [Rhizobium rhizogenes]NTG39022.1 VOC family protein [Rhizobium rhizogenes]
MSTINNPAVGIGKVSLTVQDLDRASSFYQQAIGLHLLRGDASTVELGVEGNTLLELRRDSSARRRSPREAGLFHTAFLLPTRADLGRWMKHAIETRPPIVGASDHSVSEALYLSDPEGNGVEIYADRPLLSWQWKDGQVHMPSDQLDIDSVLAAADSGHWTGFPEGSKVGHVHLQVGAIPDAEAFYSEILGFAITSRYPGGTFYAAGGYHHHLATNIWNSRGAGERSYPSTGLANIEILADPDFAASIGDRSATGNIPTTGISPGLVLRDPWGTEITIATPTAEII